MTCPADADSSRSTCIRGHRLELRYGRTPSLTWAERLAEPRLYSISTRRPGSSSSTAAATSSESRTRWPSIERITSPSRSPAAAAGAPGTVSTITAPAPRSRIRRAHAQIGAADAAAALELSRDAPQRVDRHGERQAVATALGDHADHPPATVEERAAGVAGVDGGVGLDGVADGRAVRSGDAPSHGGHHARGEAARQAEGVADRYCGVSGANVGRPGQRQRFQVTRTLVFQAQDRQIGGSVAAEHAGARTAATQPYRNDVGAGHNVLVGDDPSARYREAGAGGDAVVLARRAVGPLHAGLAPLHYEHRLARAAVDLPHCGRGGAGLCGRVGLL